MRIKYNFSDDCLYSSIVRKYSLVFAWVCSLTRIPWASEGGGKKGSNLLQWWGILLPCWDTAGWVSSVLLMRLSRCDLPILGKSVIGYIQLINLHYFSAGISLGDCKWAKEKLLSVWGTDEESVQYINWALVVTEGHGDPWVLNQGVQVQC